MMLAARGAFLAAMRKPSTPTAKSYVQDGLVAMWDGIENAGWGVHDNNASGWTELVGGRDLTTSSGTWEWGDDCWKVITLARGSLGRSGVNFGSIRNTCEACFMLSSTKNSSPLLIGFGGSQRMLNLKNNNLFARPTYSSKYISFADCLDIPVSLSCDYLESDDVDRISINGVARTLNVASPSWVLLNLNQLGRTTLTGTESTYAIQSHYCVRIYNRVLNAAEVAANYAVDKARFNLPDAT